MPPWPSPLAPYSNPDPLPHTLNKDGKSLYNPPAPRSSAYDEFPKPIDPSNNGFDFHVYYMPSNNAEFNFARELHERIRREFPELRIYKFWDKPVGPHPTAMFEVNTFTPHQTGAFFSWLVVNRGPCSNKMLLHVCDNPILSGAVTRIPLFLVKLDRFTRVLVHPNTDDQIKDHTELATWMGKPWPLNIDILTTLTKANFQDQLMKAGG